MLQNAYFLAKIGADTAENEQHFAEILPIGRRGPSPEALVAVGQQGPLLRRVPRPAARCRPVRRSLVISGWGLGLAKLGNN